MSIVWAAAARCQESPFETFQGAQQRSRGRVALVRVGVQRFREHLVEAGRGCAPPRRNPGSRARARVLTDGARVAVAANAPARGAEPRVRPSDLCRAR